MSDEARKEQKVKAKALKVKYKSATLEDFIEQYAKDISRTGMWIKTPKPPALGELLKIEIQLKDETPVLKAAGRVVQRREEAEARPDAPPGMGVRFLKVDEGMEVLERIMARKGEGAGPHFESLRPSPASVAPQANFDARSGDFFGNGPQPPLPAEQDQTVMRQMNALLGEALRIAKSPSQAAGEGAGEGEGAKAVGSMKSTMVGMGLAEAAEAVKSARSALAQAEAAKPIEDAKPAAAPALEPPPPRSAAQLHVGSTPAPAATGNLRATMEFTSGAIDVVKAPSEPPGTVPMKAADVAAVSDDRTQRASQAELDAALRAMRELPDELHAAAPVAEAKEEAPVAAVVVEAKEETPAVAVAVAVVADEVKEEAPVAVAVAVADADEAKEESPAAAAASTEEAAAIDEDARVTAVPEKKPEVASIERLIEKAVEESPASVRPAATVAPATARAVDVDAAPKKRSPVMLYAAIGVVLAVGVVAVLMRSGGDTPVEPTPAPITEPTPGGDPGPAATTPPIPPRELPTPPTIEQAPTPPPVPTVQPQPQTTAEPDPPRPAPPEPAPAPQPAPAPEPTPAVVAPVVPPRPAVRPLPRPIVRPAPAPRLAPVVAAPTPAPRPAPVAAPAPAPAPRPAAPSSGAVPPNPFE
jgi:uncharacterized protein (TIGR02266 family)